MVEILTIGAIQVRFLSFPFLIRSYSCAAFQLCCKMLLQVPSAKQELLAVPFCQTQVVADLVNSCEVIGNESNL